MTAIGIAGTGRMGTAFAKRLIETGHAVTVWNRTPERTEPTATAGATIALDLVELAGCDVIVISLTDASAGAQVLDGLVEAGIEGRLLVDMSTVLPDEAAALAARATAAGAEFVECPVGGTVAPALKGQLLGMAGGTHSAVARARPILELLCRRVEHIGPAGSGARMKLAVNLPLAIYWEVLGEALTLLKDAGISNEAAISLIADSSAGPNVLKTRSQVVIDTMNGTDQLGTFDVNGLAKDLRLALRLAAADGRHLPLAEATSQIYDRAMDRGLGPFDGASLARLAQE